MEKKKPTTKEKPVMEGKCFLTGETIRIFDPKGLMKEPDMPLDAEEGYKVTVTERSINSGYSHDKENANKHLKVGCIYTIERTDVQDWSTDVWIKEVPGVRFNSVHFKPIDPHP